MFITGPNVIKAITGEEVDFESLGGAAVHLGTSGVASLTAPGEQESLALCRTLLSYLPSNNVENPPSCESNDDPARGSAELERLGTGRRQPTLFYA